MKVINQINNKPDKDKIIALKIIQPINILAIIVYAILSLVFHQKTIAQSRLPSTNKIYNKLIKKTPTPRMIESVEDRIKSNQYIPPIIKYDPIFDHPVFADSRAIKGGSITLAMEKFPLTFRTVGPDSSSAFADIIYSHQLSLIFFHPNTNSPQPSLAKRWMIDKTNTEVFYQLDPNARWSDGTRVTSRDYTFISRFISSKHINSQKQRLFHRLHQIKITSYGDHLISVSVNKSHDPTNLLEITNLKPIPSHFHRINARWVEDYNWKIEPNTGAYQIESFALAKSITFSRKTDWWAEDYKYNQNLYNFDKITYKFIKNFKDLIKQFISGNIDLINVPDHYSDKKINSLLPLNLGYVKKLSAFTDRPVKNTAIFLNLQKPLWSDYNSRKIISNCIDVDTLMANKQINSQFTRSSQLFEGYDKYTNTDITYKNYSPEDCNQAKNLASKLFHNYFLDNSTAISSIKLIYSDLRKSRIIKSLYSQLSKHRINLEATYLHKVKFYKAIKNGDFDALWLETKPLSSILPDYQQMFHSDFEHDVLVSNYSKGDYAKLNILIDFYQNAHNLDNYPQQKIIYSKAIQKTIDQINAVIPLYSKKYSRLYAGAHLQFPNPLGTKKGGIDINRMWFCESCADQLTELRENSTENYHHDQNHPAHIIDDTYKPSLNIKP